MLLQINHLSKNYGGVRALDNISLSLDAGMVLGLVGDNGAGKSTLLKCITGSQKPDEGEILFDGRHISPGDPYASRNAGIEMIYQDLNLCSRQSVASNIFLGREPTHRLFNASLPLVDINAMHKGAAELLGRLQAPIATDKIVGSLSGGQQQAVAIARAMSFQPKLLIMDEPTAALGVKEVSRVLHLIRSLKGQGIAIILVSHRLGDIFEVADRVALMRHGRIHEELPIGETSLVKLTQKILHEEV